MPRQDCAKGCDEHFKEEDANKVFITKSCSYMPNDGAVQLMELLVKDFKTPSWEKEAFQKGLLRGIEKYQQD